MKKIIICLILFILGLSFFSCQPDVVDEKQYTIILSTDIGELSQSQYILKEKETLTLSVLEADGYNFLGWHLEHNKEIITSYTPTSLDSEVIKIVAAWEEKEKDSDDEILRATAIKNIIDEIDINNLNIQDYNRLNDLLTEIKNFTNPEALALITNIDILKGAIVKINNLNLVNHVINLISLLPKEITLNDISKITEALDAYDNLSNDLKEKVSNYNELSLALATIEQLKQEEEAKIADKVIQSILALPYYVTYDFKNEVTDTWEAYQKLSDSQKDLVPTNLVTELNNDYSTITKIEQDENTITYCLGQDVFNSKKELCNAWYSDFYKFILNHNGTEKLQNEGITNVNRFVELAQDWDAGVGKMYYLGDTFSQYYLMRDVQGILENQSADYFIGFCYANNRYENYIPFSMMEFAYWRLDEKYADLTNYGADPFADRWATLVDNCKFFYCEAGQRPTPRTDRMTDCFNNIANVVYGELPTKFEGSVDLNTNLTRRGFIFDGWYDNPDFSGEPITTVESGTGKKILYAKWIIDQEQVDKDAAAYCDIYIYNLTTQKAVLNSTTVGYVKTMYENLTDEAKALVTKYNTLQNYISQYCK